MAARKPVSDEACGIAHALGVLGDSWTLLVLRDIAGGHRRFDELVRASGISRKVLAQRLAALVADGVLERRSYSEHPPRHEYVLTPRGRATLPVLAALQEFGDRWLLADGRVSATADEDSAEVRRVRALVGQRVPELASLQPVTASPLTVVYCYPGTNLPDAGSIPGGEGCTLESCTYRDRLAEFDALGAAVVGVSTQRPDEQAAFGERARIPFPLLSDTALELTAALRLPTFRSAGAVRLKRLTLVVDAARSVRGVLYPIADVTGSVEDALGLVRSLSLPAANG